ncbi:hypothetical protein [Colwellia psychrerythraea]|uniref:Uncharacterized protein n=1 Tax=Colwellia psychrerythraea (strain 34H / ATCC BAA-681) TaxID=167879 RepID=Q484Z4_COLP3|nr:hypothetical protein [Colwellia psychrerythraea]AAZ26342.1 hypothetical protein CPS_1633 [Colwellia psychrerythraea 34H]
MNKVCTFRVHSKLVEDFNTLTKQYGLVKKVWFCLFLDKELTHVKREFKHKGKNYPEAVKHQFDTRKLFSSKHKQLKISGDEELFERLDLFCEDKNIVREVFVEHVLKIICYGSSDFHTGLTRNSPLHALDGFLNSYDKTLKESETRFDRLFVRYKR